LARGDWRRCICGPQHNLIQHLRLHDDGVTFRAERVAAGKYDFFASEDRWCRPVMIRDGPDGALWVADMYRYVLEHPNFLPPHARDTMMHHYRAGEDRGRIYRIARPGLKPFAPLRI